MQGESHTGQASQHRVTIEPLPRWLDSARLLGPQTFSFSSRADEALRAEAMLSRADAADVAARLRGLGFGGCMLEVTVQPPLPRAAVRVARSTDAKRRWQTSVGFNAPRARVDEEGRMSLTPEELALQIAKAAKGKRVVDACCGVGGNTIAFARAGCQVTAIDIDPERLALAKHNARVYSVAEHISFLHGNATTLLSQLKADVLFIDVPWGSDWNRHVVTLAELPLLSPLLAHAQYYKEVWLKVPPSFDTRELLDFEPMAMFGAAEGDARRVKFLWLRSRQ